jgi:hypothetical protein
VAAQSTAAAERAMDHLGVGNQIFHDGNPVQLLYRVARVGDCEIWRVRPLFVDGPDREERFTWSDRISFLHTMRTPIRN